MCMINFFFGIYYRPQRSCGKVMFSRASVILSKMVSGRHPPPPWQTLPGRQTSPWSDTPLGRHPSGQTPLLGRHPHGQTPPGQNQPPSRHPPGQTSPPAQQTTTAADGTHPTGMQSCSFKIEKIVMKILYSNCNSLKLVSIYV